MVLLQEVDKPGSEVEEYVNNLDAILAHKMETIQVLRSRLYKFHEHLKQQQTLNQKFHSKQSQLFNVFDLSNPELVQNQCLVGENNVNNMEGQMQNPDLLN
jgi:hypothetical protein